MKLSQPDLGLAESNRKLPRVIYLNKLCHFQTARPSKALHLLNTVIKHPGSFRVPVPLSWAFVLRLPGGCSIPITSTFQTDRGRKKEWLKGKMWIVFSLYLLKRFPKSPMQGNVLLYLMYWELPTTWPMLAAESLGRGVWAHCYPGGTRALRIKEGTWMLAPSHA